MKMATSDLESVGKAELAGCEIYLFIPPPPLHRPRPPPNNPEADQNQTANFKGFALMLSAPLLYFLSPHPRCGAKAVSEGGPGGRGACDAHHGRPRRAAAARGAGRNRAKPGRNRAKPGRIRRAANSLGE